MTFADADLVNGDVLKAGQLRFGKSSVQMPLEDILDHVPTDAQQPGNVLHFDKLWGAAPPFIACIYQEKRYH
jgi:hypothetical protein